jgi:hypothetical protein
MKCNEHISFKKRIVKQSTIFNCFYNKINEKVIIVISIITKYLMFPNILKYDDMIIFNVIHVLPPVTIISKSSLFRYIE